MLLLPHKHQPGTNSHLHDGEVLAVEVDVINVDVKEVLGGLLPHLPRVFHIHLRVHLNQRNSSALSTTFHLTPHQRHLERTEYCGFTADYCYL